MTTLKEATSNVHKVAEQTDWAKLLISGTINEVQYAAHLVNLYAIHKTIEDRVELHEDILRTGLITNDLLLMVTLSEGITLASLPVTNNYMSYLNTLTDRDLWAHIYVIYLGELYGGQYIKKSIKFPSSHLDFNNRAECINLIRAQTLNVDHAEAIKAFEWTIELYKQLWDTYK